MPQARIAILIPCYNEEPTITKVVRDFRAELPDADIYVFDNNSTDHTVDRAREAGAHIALERRQGKGFVVQAMFQQVDADVYVIVDGDDTYPPSEVHNLIAPVLEGKAEMVVGSRLMPSSESDFRLLNKAGNGFFLRLINSIFKVKLSDVLSGYRAFSREFVKTIPVFGGGFETEVELTVKALARGYRITRNSGPPHRATRRQLLEDSHRAGWLRDPQHDPQSRPRLQAADFFRRHGPGADGPRLHSGNRRHRRIHQDGPDRRAFPQQF